jgi:hypothetical protein
MKNTIRASGKNATKPASAQPQKPSDRGQKPATLGQAKGDIGDDICRMLYLSKSSIDSLKVQAQEAGLTRAGYCKLAILERLDEVNHSCHAVPESCAKALFKAIGDVELLNLEVTAVFELLAARITQADKRDPVASGIEILVASLRMKMDASFKSLMTAYKVAIPPTASA